MTGELTDEKISAFIRDCPWVQRSTANKRQWKALKRMELRRLIKAAEDFNAGAAYTPQPVDTLRLLETLKTWRTALSVERWGR